MQNELQHHDFSFYKEISDKINRIFLEYNCSNYDRHVVLNVALGFPYILEEGYTYRGKYYKTPAEIPEYGRRDFIQRYGEGKDFYDTWNK